MAAELHFEGHQNCYVVLQIMVALVEYDVFDVFLFVYILFPNSIAITMLKLIGIKHESRTVILSEFQLSDVLVLK